MKRSFEQPFLEGRQFGDKRELNKELSDLIREVRGHGGFSSYEAREVIRLFLKEGASPQEAGSSTRELKELIKLGEVSQAQDTLRRVNKVLARRSKEFYRTSGDIVFDVFKKYPKDAEQLLGLSRAQAEKKFRALHAIYEQIQAREDSKENERVRSEMREEGY